MSSQKLTASLGAHSTDASTILMSVTCDEFVDHTLCLIAYQKKRLCTAGQEPDPWMMAKSKRCWLEDRMQQMASRRFALKWHQVHGALGGCCSWWHMAGCQLVPWNTASLGAAPAATATATAAAATGRKTMQEPK